MKKSKLKTSLLVLMVTALPVTSVMGAEDFDFQSFTKDFHQQTQYQDFDENSFQQPTQDDEQANEVADLQSFLGKKKSVKYSEIKSWQLVGDHFALGSNDNGEALALYDLSWPQVFSREHFGRTLLGSIGIGNLNVQKIIDVIRNGIKHADNDNAISTADKTVDPEKALAEIEKKYGTLTDEMPDQWWQKIKWKNQSMTSSESEPTEFLVSDMDLAGMSHKSRKFNKVLEQTSNTLRDELDLDLQGNLFNYFKFVKRSEGKGYDLFFIVPEQNYVQSSLALRPKKVGDFRNPNKSFVKTVGIMGAKFALDQILGMIPVPVVPNLLKAVVNRWFDLLERQEVSHLVMALEYLDQTTQGNVNSPLASLTQDQQHALGLYILTQQASLFDLIFKKSKATDYNQYVADRDAADDASRAWLTKKGYALTDLDGRFAWGEKEGKKKLFLLNEHYRFSKQPFTGMNYQTPQWELVWRHLAAGLDLAITYIPIPVSYVNTALSALYGYFVMDMIDLSQEQEARFLAWISVHPAGEWKDEQKHMLDRRMNPFELDPVDEASLIARRRVELGI